MQTVMTKLSTAEAVTTLATTSLADAKHFYQDILGFDVDAPADSPGFLFVHCGHDSKVTLYERPEPTHCDTTQLTFLVDDIMGVMDDLRSRGVTFEEYDLAWLKTTNGVAIQGNAKAAWFKDPGGNMLSITQM